MKVVPAILAENFDDFLLKLKQAESFAQYVQIDLMDGIFVPTKSFSPEKINAIHTSLSFEIHLMVQNPVTVLNQINNPGLDKVLFHFESHVEHLHFINQIKEKGLKAGIAIKPETRIEEFNEIAKYVDTLLFLTVDPCCYGHPFKPEVLEKIAEARKLFPNVTISVDGGVSLDNLKSFIEIGVNYVCVGSRIFLNGTPEKNYKRFMAKLTKLNVWGS